MISRGDTEAGGEVVGNGPDGGLELERNPVGLYAAIERNANNEGYIEPIDVLVPVCTGHGCLCDVWLLRVIFGVSIGF